MKYRYFFLQLVITVILISDSNAQGNKKSAFEKVKVDGGFISGKQSISGNIFAFKGIPFAAPPVGDLRWKAPQPVIAWSGTKLCDKFGPSPMQGKPAAFSMWSEEFLIPKEPISEDCLYLNVWTSASSEKEKRPVLVWIYGGGFSSGGSAAPIYDGEAMAKKGIIFVSINYRVGVFGFFAHPELTKESGNNASGNYGIMDQIAALKWVQKNIAAFGGDPSNVTIAGQSAGSMSVNCLVASPLAKNLFKRAIAQSGASFTNLNTGLQQAEKDGEKMMQSFNISSINEFRKFPADELFQKARGGRPIIDGFIIPDAILNIFKERKENKVDLLTGWNQDETLGSGATKTADAFKTDAMNKYGNDVSLFLKYFPADNDSIAILSQANLSRDMSFGIQNYTWANMQNANGSKVYVYRFIRKPPATGEYLKYGAFHTGEVPYAYDNLKFVNRPWKEVDHRLATIMSSYWVNFVKFGDPNGDGLPVWDAYNSSDKKTMMLGEKAQSTPMPDSKALDFLYKKATGN